jgi:outer membrane protein assembly factor BamD (BamD/ComL family)
MKTNAQVARRLLPSLALLIALLPGLCACTSLAQRGSVDLAYQAYGKGDYTAALTKLSFAEALHNEMTAQQHAEILLLKGRCLEGLGNRGEAASLYEYLCKTYPDTEFAARAKGRLEELRKAP